MYVLFYIVPLCMCKRDFFESYAKNPEIRVRLWKSHTTDHCVLFKNKQWTLQNLFIPNSIPLSHMHSTHPYLGILVTLHGHEAVDMTANGIWPLIRTDSVKLSYRSFFPNITIIGAVAIGPVYFWQTRGIFCLSTGTIHPSYLCDLESYHRNHNYIIIRFSNKK